MSMCRVSFSFVPARGHLAGWLAIAPVRVVAGSRTGIIAILLSAVSLLAGCSSLVQSWKAPEVELVGFQPKEVTLVRQVFVATLRVKNPNDRMLPIKGMTYQLSLEGQEVAQGGAELDRQLPAFGETTLDVDVVGNLLSLTQQLPALMTKNRPLDWTITGTASIAGGLLTLPYRYSGSLDAQALMAGARKQVAR
jgi:LEA14-like dessication related protein